MCPLKLDLTQESNVPPLNNEFESNVPPHNMKCAEAKFELRNKYGKDLKGLC